MTFDGYIIKSKELYHYGVLGMKWGIRRYQPYPPGKHGTFLDQTRDKDIRIKKGTTAYRVQNSEKIDDRAGQMYASITSSDNISYIRSALYESGAVATDVRLQNGNNGMPYTVKFKFTQDVILPSYKELMEAFCETFGDVSLSNVNKKLGKIFKKKELEAYSAMYKDDGIEDVRDHAYLLFVGSMMRDTKARTSFIQNLQKKGYNAIVDDWDYNFEKGSFTDTPIIIFDRSKTVKQVSSMKLTDKILKSLTESEYSDEPFSDPNDLKNAYKVYKDFEKFYDDESWKSNRNIRYLRKDLGIE